MLFVVVDESGKHGAERGPFNNLYSPVSMNGDIIPGGHIHLRIPPRRDISMRAREDSQDLGAVRERMLLFVTNGNMTHQDILPALVRFELQRDMGTHRPPIADADEDGKRIRPDERVNFLRVFLFVAAGNVHILSYRFQATTSATFSARMLALSMAILRTA